MTGRSRFYTIVLPSLALLGFGFAVVSIVQTAPRNELVDPHLTPPTAPGDASETFIGASGLAEAASEQIAVSGQTSGRVQSVAVTPGMNVHAGDPLFRLDSRDVAAMVLAREADLAAAEARLAEARGRIPSLAAALEAAKAALASAESDEAEAADLLRRAPSSIVGTGLTEREAMARKFAAVAATAHATQAGAAVAQAAAELAIYQRADGTAGPGVLVAQAAIGQSKAALTQASVALDLMTVRAPIDGTVLQVNIHVGEYAPAQAGGTPPIIMGQLTPLHLRVDIDEADIPRFNSSAPALASPRGAPRLRIPLTLVRVDPIVIPKVSLTGAGTERVDTRVLRVVYAFDPAGSGVFPGEQMDVFISAPAAR